MSFILLGFEAQFVMHVMLCFSPFDFFTLYNISSLIEGNNLLCIYTVDFWMSYQRPRRNAVLLFDVDECSTFSAQMLVSPSAMQGIVACAHGGT